MIWQVYVLRIVMGQERIKNQVERERTKEQNEDNRHKFLIGQCILEKYRANGHPERLAELMD